MGKILLVVVLLISSFTEYAQNYGLYFNEGANNNQEVTGIDLTGRRSFKIADEFTVVFDLQLRSDRQTKFGYILRIIGDKGANLGIIYDNFSEGKNDIVLIAGQDFTSISLDINDLNLIDQWGQIRLEVDLVQDIASFIIGDTLCTAVNIGLRGQHLFNFFFGANSMSNFETTNVPAMNVRDIYLQIDNKRELHWPLNEHSGNFADGGENHRKALVTNPVWLAIRHIEWEFEEKDSYPGKIALEDLYFHKFHKDTLKQEKLLFPDSLWHYAFASDPLKSNYYIFGGFNGKAYRNSMLEYDSNSSRWNEIEAGGSAVTPRYLSAMGIDDSGDSLFILGGYGSKSGNPLLNPHFYSDFWAYSIQDSVFSKLFDYEEGFGTHAFGRTMIIDSIENCYYALKFNPLSKNTKLQLIKGNLRNPKWNIMADPVPYSFIPEKSDIALFYHAGDKKMFCLTSYYSDSLDQTILKSYSLYYPPGVPLEIIQEQASVRRMWIWIILIILLDTAVLVIITVRKRRFKHDEKKESEYVPGFFSKDLLENNWKSDDLDKETVLPDNRIYLLGGFQFYLGPDQEISGKFSPILKELFLLILLYSSQDENGASVKKLLEQIWGDMSLKNAKNNLSVNINKLRVIIGPEMSELLVHVSGYWKFDLSDKKDLVFCDFWETWRILRSENRSNEVQILNLIHLTKRGGLLLNTNYEWLDSFKANISNEIIDLLVEYSEQHNIKDNLELYLNIADTIFLFDMINEHAVEIKCKTLVALGKHSMAKDTYNAFIRDYKMLYDEDFPVPLKELIS
ncbi:MAG: hypothetical protein P1P82_12785 [Bacteroidales bacterium]|nr:hypothetical protein [Bacteroidales bacterium]MDT8432380.1 hypothetical protein [Bacteroidales bacterium]